MKLCPSVFQTSNWNKIHRIAYITSAEWFRIVKSLAKRPDYQHNTEKALSQLGTRSPDYFGFPVNSSVEGLKDICIFIFPRRTSTMAYCITVGHASTQYSLDRNWVEGISGIFYSKHFNLLQPFLQFRILENHFFRFTKNCPDSFKFEQLLTKFRPFQTISPPPPFIASPLIIRSPPSQLRSGKYCLTRQKKGKIWCKIAKKRLILFEKYWFSFRKNPKNR